MKKLMQKMGAVALMLLFLSPAFADDLLMARVNQQISAGIEKGASSSIITL